jgi:adenine-specific DNA methylase
LLNGKCFILIECNVSKGIIMAKCPVCGKEVATPKKTWKMAGRADKSGKKTELTIGLFEHCGKTFRSTLGKRKI